MRKLALISSITFTLLLIITSYLLPAKEIISFQAINLSNNQKITTTSQIEELIRVKPNLYKITLNNSMQVYFKSKENLNLEKANVTIIAKVSKYEGSTRIVAEQLKINAK